MLFINYHMLFHMLFIKLSCCLHFITTRSSFNYHRLFIQLSYALYSTTTCSSFNYHTLFIQLAHARQSASICSSFHPSLNCTTIYFTCLKIVLTTLANHSFPYCTSAIQSHMLLRTNSHSSKCRNQYTWIHLPSLCCGVLQV